MLGSWTIAKREKCWVLGQPPSGHISTVEKIAERIKRNPSPASGRGVGVRAFVRRTNLVKRNRQAFFALLRRYATPPPASGRRDYPLFSKRFSHTARWVDTYGQAGQMLASRTAAKREKCWVLGLLPSGHISTVEKIAERTKRNPSPACGRGAGVRAFVRRMNLTQAGQTGVFCPPPSLRDTSSRRREEGLVVRVFVLGYSQAGEMLGSWAVAKREKCWVPRLPPSGHRYLPISVAEKTGRNPSPACGRGVGVRAFVRRMNLTQAGQTGVFCPPPSLRDTSSRRREEGLVVRVFVLGYSQAGEMLGSWAVAKREKCWVPRLPPSGTNAGFSDCRQAGQILGSRTAAKRDKCWGLGLPSSEGITVCLSPAKRRCSAVFCFCPAVFNRR